MNLSVRSNWRILYWRFELPLLSSQVSSSLAMALWACHVLINICNFNIGRFSEKLAIANKLIVLYGA